MDCLFCKIAAGSIPADVVYDDKDILGFRDIAPQAPTHLLIIPKTHIATLNDTNDSHEPLLGRMVLVAQQLAKANQFDQAGYRLVMNTNQDGGQAVYHIHLHVLGGRQLAWPPG